MPTRALSAARDRIFRLPHSQARGPAYLPLRFVRIFWLATEDFLRNDGFQRAGALAFATMLSLLPLAVLFFSLAGVLGGGDRIIAHVQEEIFPKLAPGFREELNEWMQEFISRDAFRRTRGVGVLNVAAILGLVIAAMGMMVAAERNLNRIFRAGKNRSYFKKMRAFWLVLSLSPFLIAASMTVSGYLAPEGGFIDRLMGEFRWVKASYEFVVPLVIGLAGFSVLYIALPNRRVPVRSALFGALVAALFWEGSKHLFFVYLEGATNVTSFYPKVAALPLFLIWLLLNWTIVLIGAEMAYVHQDLGRLSALKEAAKCGALPVLRAALQMLDQAAAAFGRGEPVRAEAIARDLDVGGPAALSAGRLLVEEGVLVEDAANPGRFHLAGDPALRRLEDVVASLLARLPSGRDSDT